MKISLVAAMSADAKIAESSEQNSLDWTSKEDTKFFIRKTKEAGVVIMGRKTFDTIGKGLKGRRIIVMTRQEGLVFDGEGVEYTNLSPKELVEQLESEGAEHAVLGGGAAIYGQFLKEGLVTDVHLTIEPVMFGGGVPLAEGFDRISMKLKEIEKLNDHTVMLHYII
jgi:dihydrofolate reductase